MSGRRSRRTSPRPGRRLLDAEGRLDDGRHREHALDASAVGHRCTGERSTRGGEHHARRVQHRGQTDPRLSQIGRPVDGGRHRVHRRRRDGGHGGTPGGARAHPGTPGISMPSTRRGANRRTMVRSPDAGGLLLLVVIAVPMGRPAKRLAPGVGPVDSARAIDGRDVLSIGRLPAVERPFVRSATLGPSRNRARPPRPLDLPDT